MNHASFVDVMTLIGVLTALLAGPTALAFRAPARYMHLLDRLQRPLVNVITAAIGWQAALEISAAACIPCADSAYRAITAYLIPWPLVGAVLACGSWLAFVYQYVRALQRRQETPSHE